MPGDYIGGDGGSSGGSHSNLSGGAVGSATANQGFTGGVSDSGNTFAGGGGGAGGAGADNINTTGGGGAGVSSSITGSAVTRAEGGGVATNLNGTVNSGKGGGGSLPNTNDGANGGSGVVILKYTSSFTITIGAGLTGSTVTDGSFKVTTITAGTGNVSWAAA